MRHYGGFSGETSSITGGDSSYILNINAGGGGGAGGWSLDALPGVSVSYTNPLTGNTETSSGGGAGTSKSSRTPSSGNGVSGNGGIHILNKHLSEQPVLWWLLLFPYYIL